MTQADQLAAHTREGDLYEPLEGNRIRCVACGHRCPIPPGKAAFARSASIAAASCYVPYGYVSALQCDPIEKKPFFHVLPGALALSFGMLGCDLHCGYCQNWVTSQALRDSDAIRRPRAIGHAGAAGGAGAAAAAPSSVVSTYNEPLITSEWAVAVFREAKRGRAG